MQISNAIYFCWIRRNVHVVNHKYLFFLPYCFPFLTTFWFFLFFLSFRIQLNYRVFSFFFPNSQFKKLIISYSSRRRKLKQFCFVNFFEIWILNCGLFSKTSFVSKTRQCFKIRICSKIENLTLSRSQKPSVSICSHF